jgi:hypothetical protein
MLIPERPIRIQRILEQLRVQHERQNRVEHQEILTDLSDIFMSQPPTEVVMPSATKPKIGGLDSSGKPWTGGTPASKEWKSSANSKPATLLCLRLSGKDGVRMYSDRIKGTEVKFKANDAAGISLQAFANDVNLHLVNHGMDSVFHVRDSDGELVDLIHEHPRMTIQGVTASIKMMTEDKLYDEYDKDNLRDSLMYLLNSVDAAVKQEITPFLTAETTGPELWMRIVGTVQSSTIERLSKLLKTIRNIKLTDYKENIKEYCRVMIGYAKELDAAHKLPEEMCYIILDQLCDCSNEKFKLDFMGLRKTVAMEIREYHGKSRDAIRNIQVSKGHYTYLSLLQEASETYQTLVDLGQWNISTKNKDRGGAPEAMTAEANALVQKITASLKKSFNGDKTRTSSGGKVFCFFM